MSVKEGNAKDMSCLGYSMPFQPTQCVLNASFTVKEKTMGLPGHCLTSIPGPVANHITMVTFVRMKSRDITVNASINSRWSENKDFLFTPYLEASCQNLHGEVFN